MSYDPRTIAYLAEIIYQPMELKAERVQNIHNALYRKPEISYQNFQIAADGIHLTNIATQPGSVSSVSFRPDRMILREELRGITVEDFATRLVNVASISFATLGIQLCLAQQFAVRSLMNPRSVQDTRQFLARRLITAPEPAWECFGRPMQSLGLSLTFPQTKTDNEVFCVRIETWNQDPRSLWVENVGSFMRPVPAERIPDLGSFLFATYRFATGPVANFIATFDQP